MVPVVATRSALGGGDDLVLLHGWPQGVTAEQRGGLGDVRGDQVDEGYEEIAQGRERWGSSRTSPLLATMTGSSTTYGGR